MERATRLNMFQSSNSAAVYNHINKFSSVARQAEGKFWHAVWNWVKVLILQEGTLIQSIKEGQNLDPEKT